jgi:hypothetical protein
VGREAVRACERALPCPPVYPTDPFTPCLEIHHRPPNQPISTHPALCLRRRANRRRPLPSLTLRARQGAAYTAGASES